MFWLVTFTADGQIDPAPLVTHRFGLEDMMEAYDVFSRPSETGALKVLLERSAG